MLCNYSDRADDKIPMRFWCYYSISEKTRCHFGPRLLYFGYSLYLLALDLSHAIQFPNIGRDCTSSPTSAYAWIPVPSKDYYLPIIFEQSLSNSSPQLLAQHLAQQPAQQLTHYLAQQITQQLANCLIVWIVKVLDQSSKQKYAFGSTATTSQAVLYYLDWV